MVPARPELCDAFVRLGAALALSVLGCPAPVYRFMLSDIFTFDFPPEPYARGGLEGAPFGTETTNVACVENALSLVENARGHAAGATEIRQALRRTGRTPPSRRRRPTKQRPAPNDEHPSPTRRTLMALTTRRHPPHSPGGASNP